MSEKKPAEQADKAETATQPETGAPSAPPSPDSVRASDQPVTAQAQDPTQAPAATPLAIAAATVPKATPVMRGKVPTIPADAPLYRARKVHFLNGRIVEKDEKVRYAGVPGTGLEPLDDAARKAVAEAEKARAARKAEAESNKALGNELRKALKKLGV